MVCAWWREVVLAADAKVLLLGTGGVSIFGLQIATALGAEAIITSSDDRKLEKARALGAIQGINYRSTPEWEKEVWSFTNQRGVDHILEVGGPGTLGRSMSAVAAGGHIALIGVLTGFDPPNDSVFPLVAKNVRLDGIYVGHRAALERLLEFVGEKAVTPVVDRVFAFEDARERVCLLGLWSALW